MLNVRAETEIRIDWVGEPGHAQPQDQPPTTHPNALGPIYETRQALNAIPYTNDDNDDDLQQKIEPADFDKGTYVEFDKQHKINP